VAEAADGRPFPVMAIFAIMKRKRKATLLLHDEVRDDEGWRVIIKVWEVERNPVNPDGVDYSLALISPAGERVVGYDNHWPKGHHRHVRGEEGSYAYQNVNTLIADFRADIARARRSKP